jgi:hypothetical protein
MTDPSKSDICTSQTSAGHCEPGSTGDIVCRNKLHQDAHRTQCFNKDSSNAASDSSNSACHCSPGYKAEKARAKKGTEDGTCIDVNECVEKPHLCAHKSRSADRYACHNVPGSYSCIDNIADECEPEKNYGGCWNEPQADGESLSACKDNLKEYQQKAAQYTGAEADWQKSAPPLHTCDCAVVKGCYTGPGSICTKKCDDAHCNSSTSQCVKSNTSGALSALCCCSLSCSV